MRIGSLANARPTTNGDATAYQTWGNLGDAYRWAPGKRPQAGAAYLRASQLLDEQIRLRSSDTAALALQATDRATRGDLAAARATLSAAVEGPRDGRHRAAFSNQLRDTRPFASSRTHVSLPV